MSIASIFESGEVTQNRGHIKNLVLLSKVDGTVSDEELLLIQKIGKKIGLSYAQIGEIIDNPNVVEVIPPVSKVERLEHMVDMIDMIHIDGVIDPKELRLIGKFAVQIGFKSLDDVPVSSILDMMNEGKSRDAIVTALS